MAGTTEKSREEKRRKGAEEREKGGYVLGPPRGPSRDHQETPMVSRLLWWIGCHPRLPFALFIA
jgi:hypothetical protein